MNVFIGHRIKRVLWAQAFHEMMQIIRNRRIGLWCLMPLSTIDKKYDDQQIHSFF
jgi:hypothetical protein